MLDENHTTEEPSSLPSPVESERCVSPMPLKQSSPGHDHQVRALVMSSPFPASSSSSSRGGSPVAKSIEEEREASERSKGRGGGGGRAETEIQGTKLRCTHQAPYPNCKDLTFDRPCEWRRHMDKHERPFHCSHPDCADIKGFTYQGGLIRHEREVHNKFGGPREVLNCPIPYCKRHTGPGFTRRENLNEHIRRLHRTSSSGSGMKLEVDEDQEEEEEKAITGSSKKRKASRCASDVSITKSVKVKQPSIRRRTESYLVSTSISKPSLVSTPTNKSSVDFAGANRLEPTDPSEDIPSDDDHQVNTLKRIIQDQAREIVDLHEGIVNLKSVIHTLTAPRAATWPVSSLASAQTRRSKDIE